MPVLFRNELKPPDGVTCYSYARSPTVSLFVFQRGGGCTATDMLERIARRPAEKQKGRGLVAGYYKQVRPHLVYHQSRVCTLGNRSRSCRNIFRRTLNTPWRGATSYFLNAVSRLEPPRATGNSNSLPARFHLD